MRIPGIFKERMPQAGLATGTVVWLLASGFRPA